MTWLAVRGLTCGVPLTVDNGSVVRAEDDLLNGEKEIALPGIGRSLPQPFDLRSFRPYGPVGFEDLKAISEKLIQTVRISLRVESAPHVDLLVGENCNIVQAIVGSGARNTQAGQECKQGKRKDWVAHLSVQFAWG